MSRLRDILRGVPQDAEFHPEGDVWTHTRAVRVALDEAISLLRNTSLAKYIPDEPINMLRAAAWCHDLGKAHATRMIDRRWRSPRHERPIHLNPILRQLRWPWNAMWTEASFEERKTFAYLITRHMAVCDACGPDPRVTRALRSTNKSRRERAGLLIILMMMDRLGCDRPSRVEDAMLVASAVEKALANTLPAAPSGHRHCWERNSQPSS